MKRIAFLLVAVATVAAVVASMIPASGQAALVFVTKMPAGYRDWPVISVAHEAGDLNSLGVKLGNDVAIKAYREGKLPFPDGTIIAAVHWSHVPVGRKQQRLRPRPIFRSRPATNIQFMIKDSKKYAATGGWGLVTSTKTARLATTL